MNEPEALYIILLWPSDEDAAAIECYTREVSAKAGVMLSLKWPVHLSLFYGIETEAPDLLSARLRAIAHGTPAPCLDLVEPGAFPESALYIKIRPCDEVLALQDKVREALRESGALVPGYPKRPEPTQFTSEETANIRQWGSWYPYLPHLTIGMLSEPEKLGCTLASAAQLFSLLPPRIVTNRMSLALTGGEWGVSETVESYNLMPPDPGALSATARESPDQPGGQRRAPQNAGAAL